MWLACLIRTGNLPGYGQVPYCRTRGLMEQRFTFKDFFLFAILAVLAVLILLSMYQVDRQWEKMSEMQRTMAEQAKEMRSLRGLAQSIERRISSGAVATNTEGARGSAEESIPPAFQRAYAATKLPGYAPGDWLVQAFGTGLKTITPLVSTDAYAADIQNYVLESLLTRNPESLKWEGMLAKSWQVSPDGLTFTFQLRKGVKFSDGTDMTAEDVVFTFDFIMNPAIAAPRERAYYDKIKSVTAVDKYEVRFEFKEPYYDSLALAGSMTILPKHFYGRYLAHPEKFNQSKGLLLGTGPYRLKDAEGWTPDQGLVELERNPFYWGPVLPSFKRLLWKVIENDSARLTTYRNGDIDIYGARPREYKQLLADPDIESRSQHFEYMSPTAGYSYIAWNETRNGKPTRFADPRVRRAMTYLTDRQRIIDTIFLGYAEPAVSPFNPSSPQHDLSLKPRPFDLQKARELLREAGYEDRNGDGVLEDKDGKPFKFDLVYFQDSEDTKRMVLFLKDLYARAGIVLRPKPTEWSVMLDLINRREFDAITLGWTSGIETDIYQIFHSSQAAKGGDDFIDYKNPKLDALIEKARSTVDEAKRMPIWQACERVLYEDQPYTFLMRRKSLVFVDRRMHNIQITRMGLNLGIVPVEWYVPAKEQKYTD